MDQKTGILRKASFSEEKGVKILRIKGSPYEMGYQHGFLLADGVEAMTSRTLTAAAARVADRVGCDIPGARERMEMGRRLAEPFLPRELKEEMTGVADGAAAAGKKVSLDDILLWNTVYDQYCVYAHPFYMDCFSVHRQAAEGGKAGEAAPGSPPPGGAGCSSFSAWGDAAGGDGALIFGKNIDNYDLPGQLENRILVAADPDEGYGHAFLTFPGMIGLDGGLNENGVAMMTQYNASIHETMRGCGIAIFTRLLLTRAGALADAVDIFNHHTSCTGLAYHVADARAREAAVVEVSSRRVCVRRPEPGRGALWQCNHSNCYPGWMGYEGYNMVADQAKVYELPDVSSIEKWQESLRDPANSNVPASSRFERYGQLLAEHHGDVTVENAIRIMGDRYDPYTGKTRPGGAPSTDKNNGATICSHHQDYAYSAAAPEGPIEFTAHIATIWSLIARPETGDFWLAIE
ncbi:MAG: hypothetical protein GY859_39380, partial [Desulfobacterales bacterium]|nr:hypothetical protein [Desulfobacterales bacterium]